MKALKGLLIAQAGLMYVAQIPIYAFFMVFFFGDSLNPDNNVINAFFIFFIVINVILMIMFMPILILSIVSIFKGEEFMPKTVMIIKLALIPWFITNFIFCFFIFVGMLNPWLMIAEPIAIAIMVSITYLYTVTTSIPNIGYIIHLLRKKELKITNKLIFSVIFHFFFCFDVLGSILLFFETRPKEMIESEEIID